MTRNYFIDEVTDTELKNVLNRKHPHNNVRVEELRGYLRSLNRFKVKSFAQKIIDGNVDAIYLLQYAYRKLHCVQINGPYVELEGLTDSFLEEFSKREVYDGRRRYVRVRQDAHLPLMLFCRLPYDSWRPLYGWERRYPLVRKNLLKILMDRGFDMSNLQELVRDTNNEISNYEPNSALLIPSQGVTKKEIMDDIMRQFDAVYVYYPHLWNLFVNLVFFYRGIIDDFVSKGKEYRIGL